MTKILDREAPILRKIAGEVPIEEISSKEIQTIIAKMKKALKAQDDGVAIAAPQIGESVRIFVVAGRALTLGKKKTTEVEIEPNDLVFINPKFVKLSRKKRVVEEGCLSVRWLYGKVERSEKATIEAWDETGRHFHLGGSGLLAQIFQHEVDHLNGILFIDKATEIEDLPPEGKPHNE